MELFSIFTGWFAAKSQPLFAMLGFGFSSTAIQGAVVLGIALLAMAAVIAIGYVGKLAYQKWTASSLDEPEVKKGKSVQSKTKSNVSKSKVPEPKVPEPKILEPKAKVFDDVNKAESKKADEPVSKFCLGQKVNTTNNPDLEKFIKLCEAQGLDFSKIPKLSVDLDDQMGNSGCNEISLQDLIDNSGVLWGLDDCNSFFVSYLYKENNKEEIRILYHDINCDPKQWRKQYTNTQKRNLPILNLEVELVELVQAFSSEKASKKMRV